MEMPLGNGNKRAILHICTRETIRPLRDRILTLQGFEVDSTLNYTEGPLHVLGPPVRPCPSRR